MLVMAMSWIMLDPPPAYPFIHSMPSTHFHRGDGPYACALFYHLNTDRLSLACLLTKRRRQRTPSIACHFFYSYLQIYCCVRVFVSVCSLFSLLFFSPLPILPTALLLAASDDVFLSLLFYSALFCLFTIRFFDPLDCTRSLLSFQCFDRSY